MRAPKAFERFGGATATIAAIAAVACVGAALAFLAAAVDGRSHAKAHPPTGARFASPRLYPRFEPQRGYYVAQCRHDRITISLRATRPTRISIAGSRPRSGGFRATVSVRPGQDFKVRVIQRRARRSYEVRCLPAGFPRWHFHRLRRIDSGMFVLGSRASRAHPPFVAIFDQDGTPRWWFESDTRAIDAQVLRGGTVAWSRAFGDGYGRDPRQAQEVHTVSGRLVRLIRTRGTITDPHEMTQERNGRFLVESYLPHYGVDLKPYGGPSRAAIVFPEIQELSRSGRLLRRWPLHQLSAAETAPDWWGLVLHRPRLTRGVPTFDVIHINSIDPWRDELVISTRHTDAIYGIARRTGRILWKVGGTPTPRSLRIVGGPYPADQLFGGQHDARVYPNGLLSLFDNATPWQRPERGVIYRLDIRAGTATYVRQLVDPQAPKGNCCGSVRRIPGGWLVGFGDTTLVSAFDKHGQVAFRLWWGNSYRAVPVPAGRVSPRRLNRGMEAMEPPGRVRVSLSR